MIIVLALISTISSSSKPSTTNSSTYNAPLPEIDVAPGMTDDQLKAASLHLRKKVDDVKNINWFYHQNSPKYSNSRTGISIYYAVSGNHPHTPRLVIYYVASDWLFVERYTIKADEATFEIAPKYNEIEKDNGTLSDGEVGIWEWYDNSISREEMEMVLAVIKSKKAVIRFEGKQYYKDYTISQQEKNSLKEILASWKYIGGAYKE